MKTKNVKEKKMFAGDQIHGRRSLVGPKVECEVSDERGQQANIFI